MARVSARLAIADFVIVVIHEARDRAVGADRPAGSDVQDRHGIEIQQIGVLPVNAVIIGDIFAGRPDGHPASIVNVAKAER